MVDRLPEQDVILAYSMLRRFISGPRKSKGKTNESAVPFPSILLNEELGEDPNVELFEDPAIEEAFDFLISNYDDALKNLVNR